MAPDRYKYFRIEAAELLEALSRGVLAFERSPSDASAIAPLLRHAHTLKGAARVVRQLEIADAAHALEDELTALQTGHSIAHVDGLLRLLDSVRDRLNSLAAPNAKEASALTPQAPVVRADVTQLVEVRDGIAEALADLATLRHESARLGALRELAELIERQSLTRRLTAVQHYEALLGGIHASVSELLSSIKRMDRHFSTTLDRVNRELQQTLTAAEQVQLVSAHSIFDSLARAVRDAGAELGKAVRFESAGGDVKLDGHVLDVVQRALLHLVRNAVAHGIEAPELRAKVGKPSEGRVELSVFRVDHRLCFRCQDDGQGIDLKRVSGALLAQGHQIESTDDAAVLELLLHGGITTASSVNNIAGRGIGMAAIREAVESVGATIHLENTPGMGARFDLLVPSTLASVSGLEVALAEQAAIIPLHHVRKTLAFTAESLVKNGKAVQLRDGMELVPYAPLGRLMGSRKDSTVPRMFVLLEISNHRFAVGVNQVLGCETRVMRRLPEEVPPSPCVDGAVLDARGAPILVLNVSGLAEAVGRFEMEHSTARAAPDPILIIDDSLTTRMLEQSILQSAGYRVELATSAERALELASSHRYSLFLVDVEMPGMDGFTFVETTRRDEALRQVPCILVSSRAAPADLERGKTAGASAYLVKDQFDQRELLRHVRAILGE